MKSDSPHQPGILAKTHRIHRQDWRSALPMRSPQFNFVRFGLDSVDALTQRLLKFSERYC
jgi:hypothetical protein